MSTVKKLAKQCFNDTSFDYDKFAKLIVRECLGIYEAIDNGNKHRGTLNYKLAVYKQFLKSKKVLTK